MVSIFFLAKICPLTDTYWKKRIQIAMMHFFWCTLYIWWQWWCWWQCWCWWWCRCRAMVLNLNNTISAMGGANYLSYSKVLLHTANTRSAHIHISSVVLINGGRGKFHEAKDLRFIIVIIWTQRCFQAVCMMINPSGLNPILLQSRKHSSDDPS